MKKMYAVRRYGDVLFVTDDERDAKELAEAVGIDETQYDSAVIAVVYIEGDRMVRDDA